MPIHHLKEQIARLPEQPGVYLYFNADGDTIYVGKARALRDRVRNYLGAYGADVKTDAYRSVTIWCKRFSVAFGAADLAAA